jgi:hypothetical protein
MGNARLEGFDNRPRVVGRVIIRNHQLEIEFLEPGNMLKMAGQQICAIASGHADTETAHCTIPQVIEISIL